MSEYVFQKPKRNVHSVFVHCSATSVPSTTVEDIDDWHKERGWQGVGYHYFITSYGDLQLGRSLETQPAAQKGYNEGTIAICLNGLNPVDFNDKQYKTLIDLADQIDEAYGGLKWYGHCEVSNKSCPVFPYQLVLDINRYHYRGPADSNMDGPTDAA